MLSAETFRAVVAELGQQGQDDIEWAENCAPPVDAEDFASEAIFVICNSGMKNTVARRIYEKVMGALKCGESAGTVFGHKPKSDRKSVV